MKWSEYRRMTEKQLMGRKVRLNRLVSTRFLDIPAGTVLTIEGKYNGLEVVTDPCSCCGVAARVIKLDPTALDLLD